MRGVRVVVVGGLAGVAVAALVVGVRTGGSVPASSTTATATTATATATTAAATPARRTAPTRTPAARVRYGGTVFALGDSVMLGATSCLQPLRYRVDAKGSRQIGAGLALLRERRAGLPSRVVIHLGTNGGLDRADLDQVLRVLGRKRVVTFVTVQLPDDYSRYTFERRTNGAIRALRERHPGTRVADWNALSDRHPEWTYGDGIHLTPAGCRGYAHLVDRLARAPIG